MKVILIALAIVGAAFMTNAGAQSPTITVGMWADAVSLDPHRTNDLPSARVMRQLYETLIVQSESLELEPGLATSWEQLDDVTWEFRIREDVEFHNSEALRASDVVFSLNRLADPSVAAPAAFLISFIAHVEALDEHTVRITTEYPFAPMLAHLAHPATAILNERAVTHAGDDYGTAVVVGTGPFTFERWDVQTQIVLSRNDAWWGGEIAPARLAFRPIPDGSVRAIELETGGVDIAYQLEPQDVARLEDNANVQLAAVETLTTHYLGFNTQKEPFHDVRVRQAINHAVDVDLIIEAVFAGQAVRATSPTSPRVFGANTELEPYPHALERARELLAEAGYEGGFSTTLWTPNNPQYMQIAEIVQAQLADIGVNVAIHVLEWGSYIAETAAGHHDMLILGWGTATGDADYGLYAPFHSSRFGAQGNRTFYANERVDQLLERGQRTANVQERLAAYLEAQEIIRDEAPWLFLVVPIEVTGLAADLSGFEPHPAGNHRLHTVTRNPR